MAFLEDPFFGRISISIVFALMLAGMYFFAEHLLVLTGRNFGNVNINLAIFTRRDHKSTSNDIVFESIGGNVSLMGLLRNRYLFWVVIYASLMTSPVERVLNLGPRGRDILSRIRGHITARMAGMTLKRFAGLPFVSVPCQFCLIYRRSEDPADNRTRILWVAIIPQEEFDTYMYFRTPPKNTENWDLMQEIYEAYWTGTGNFLDIRMTAS